VIRIKELYQTTTVTNTTPEIECSKQSKLLLGGRWNGIMEAIVAAVANGFGIGVLLYKSTFK